MNYGYSSFCPGWDESKKFELAKKLRILLEEFGIRHASGYNPGRSPYIEVDGLYDGVRIRRITHMSYCKRKDLVEKADRLYVDVMHLEQSMFKKR